MLSLTPYVPQKDQILQVHDEDILNGHYELPIKDIENITYFKTPIEIRHVKRWA